MEKKKVGKEENKLKSGRWALDRSDCAHAQAEERAQTGAGRWLPVDSNFLTRDSHSAPSAERTLPRLPRSYLPPPFSPLFLFLFLLLLFFIFCLLIQSAPLIHTQQSSSTVHLTPFSPLLPPVRSSSPLRRTGSCIPPPSPTPSSKQHVSSLALRFPIASPYVPLVPFATRRLMKST
jgi:hypothetical protein